MPFASFFRDIKKYYTRNDETIGGMGRLIGGFVGTIYGAGFGKLLEYFNIDNNKESYIITYASSTAGFFGGAIAFRYLTKPFSGSFAILEASFDRGVNVLDYLLEFKGPYDKCKDFLEDKKPTPRDETIHPDDEKSVGNRGISNKFIVELLSIGVGVKIGPLLFSLLAQFIAPNLVFYTENNGQNVTPESLGHEWGDALGGILGLIAVMPTHKALCFSGAFIYSLLKTLFYKPVILVVNRCRTEDHNLHGPINGEGQEESAVHYVSLSDEKENKKENKEAKNTVQEINAQIKELRKKRNGLGYVSQRRQKHSHSIVGQWSASQVSSPQPVVSSEAAANGTPRNSVVARV